MCRALLQRHPERGSVLLLMPVAVLIMIVLGSLAVDRAIVFGAQRELVATAQTAANDAAGLGLDLDELRGSGTLGYRPDRIDRIVERAAHGIDGTVRWRWRVDGDVVTVALTQTVRTIFEPAVPGGRRAEVVTATATARLVVP